MIKWLRFLLSPCIFSFFLCFDYSPYFRSFDIFTFSIAEFNLEIYRDLFTLVLKADALLFGFFEACGVSVNGRVLADSMLSMLDEWSGLIIY